MSLNEKSRTNFPYGSHVTTEICSYMEGDIIDKVIFQFKK